MEFNNFGKGQPVAESTIGRGLKSAENSLMGAVERSSKAAKHKQRTAILLMDELKKQGIDWRGLSEKIISTHRPPDIAGSRIGAVAAKVNPFLLPPGSAESVAIGRTPPYDYAWPWDASTNLASATNLADKDAGHLSYSITNGRNPGGGTASAAPKIGVYFTPPTSNGLLTISAAPSVSAYWYVGSTNSQTMRWVTSAYSSVLTKNPMTPSRLPLIAETHCLTMVLGTRTTSRIIRQLAIRCR